MYSDAWLYENDARKECHAQVKIRDGVFALQKVVKLPGGLVCMTATDQEGRRACTFPAISSSTHTAPYPVSNRRWKAHHWRLERWSR